jgi:hypothetical protein
MKVSQEGLMISKKGHTNSENNDFGGHSFSSTAKTISYTGTNLANINKFKKCQTNKINN